MAAYYFGLISYQNGRYEEALNEFNKIKKDKKFKALLPQYISQIYLLQGNYDKVIESGEESLQDNTIESGDDIKLYIAQAYYAKKNYAKAAEYYQQYKQNLPEPLLYQYGFSLFHEKQYEDAIKAFSAIAIKQDSIGQNVAWHLGSAYLNSGNKEKARSTFEFVSKLNWDKNIKELATLNFAKLSYELNFQKEAIDAFRTYLKNYAQSDKASEVKELLSKILLAENNPNEALEVFESIPNRNEKL
jgi:tetratricopeptide (TPR) repeat protein